MAYLYETHLHTSQGSGCGRSTGAEHARFYKEAGYTGIFITDHFFGGNTAAPRHLPWKYRVEHFCSGYEDALAEGQKIGLDVFFGWEETFDGDDYLVYGLDKQFLLDHPEMSRWTRKQQHDAVRAAGGCVVQAHPFRMRDYIWAIHLGADLADGVEVANAGNTPAQDAYAWHYAKKHGLYMLSGSDNHLSHAGSVLYGVALDEPLHSAADWVRHVLARAPHRLICDESRWQADVTQEPLIRTRRFDANDRMTELSGNWRDW